MNFKRFCFKRYPAVTVGKRDLISVGNYGYSGRSVTELNMYPDTVSKSKILRMGKTGFPLVTGIIDEMNESLITPLIIENLHIYWSILEE